MNTKAKHFYWLLAAAIFIILTLVITIIYLSLKSSKKVKVPLQINVPTLPSRIQVKSNVPEFRGPPIKKYKPDHIQQVGVLTSPNQETLPLYGKETRRHRDRYHYYTTTGGENLYPIPVSYKNNSCMDDNGCNELINNESVTVLGKTGNFTVNLYKNENYF